MSDRFVVEANRRTVGIAVRVRGGFRFFASDPDYRPLEATVFRKAKAMALRVAQLARVRRPSRPARGLALR